MGLYLILMGAGLSAVALFGLGALAIQAIGADGALTHALNAGNDDNEEGLNND